jgi:aryl-alcohol dehydrogenase-like predicted oxidoreductase
MVGIKIMIQMPLGNTSLKCSMLGLGTWGLGGPNDISGVPIGWRPIPYEQAKGIVHTAIDAGVTFIDSSDFYGRGKAEELIGDAIPRTNRQVVIATKGGLLPEFEPGTTHLKRDFSANHLESSLNASLRRLKRDTIDLYQLHGPTKETVRDETWESLERFMAAGKIRYIGVSMKSNRFSKLDFDSFIQNPLVSTIQVKYNLLHANQGDLIESSEIGSCALVARSPFGHGFLTGTYSFPEQFSVEDHRRRKFEPQLAHNVSDFFREIAAILPDLDGGYSELSLQYVVSNPKISLTIVGATSEHQIRKNISALEKGILNETERAIMTHLAKRIFLNDDHNS